MDKNETAIGLVIKATSFAADPHRNQRRKDVEASPYINHPIALANVLANEGGVMDPAVLCGALLHDTIEDTNTTAEELRAEFGEEITAMVLDVTDDKSIKDNARRKELQVQHGPHILPKAKLVKLADKICNLRDIVAAPPSNSSRERKTEYFEWAARVIAGVRGTHSKLEAIFDEVLALQDTM